jgi:hypothetical protein
MTETLALLTAIFFATLLVFITAHELTHLAFSTEPSGICIGNCDQVQRTVIARAYATGFTPLARNELLASTVGLIAAALFATSTVKAMAKKEEAGK